ncbi:hypothetical protein [Polymorphum gilvum]|uniref:Uncharacterized protein n=1 Tax=Polymorphum gilvum (strain LMG 25793 / CGMCC 1.9160 / SL003B-26A1) TaxID=991905 RepID=F2IVC5_POLGS|nr:hypothetical protein [Polymorphum gilvum]ADZ72643.1 hypothetical protein SL003B_4226 [Polymorphum gilvum SL003B-26A1]
MRVLASLAAAAALTAFAAAPASACDYMKSVKAKQNMSVAQAMPTAPEVLIATNDMTDAAGASETSRPATAKAPLQR